MSIQIRKSPGNPTVLVERAPDRLIQRADRIPGTTVKEMDGTEEFRIDTEGRAQAFAVSCYLRMLRDYGDFQPLSTREGSSLSGETEIRVFAEKGKGECPWELLINARGSRTHNSDDARVVAEDVKENAGDRQLGEDPCTLVVLTGGVVPPGSTVSLEWERKIPRAAATQYVVDNYDIENEDDLRQQFGS